MGLQLSHVSARRGRAEILKDVSATLPAGQIAGLIGPNGTGKSTLINAIATTLPHGGSIRFHGQPVRLGEVGFMPQHCQVRAGLSVLETVLLGRYERLGLRVAGGLIERALQVLDSFGIAHLHERAMTALSGGQQQLVLLAQRLIRQPRLLLLDEATSALDIRHQMQVFDRLHEYVQASGALVVIAIHDLNLAAQHAQPVLMLHGGHVAGCGPFDEVVTCESLRRVYGIEAEFARAPSGRTAIVPLRGCGEQQGRRPQGHG